MEIHWNAVAFPHHIFVEEVLGLLSARPFFSHLATTDREALHILPTNLACSSTFPRLVYLLLSTQTQLFHKIQ